MQLSKKCIDFVCFERHLRFLLSLLANTEIAFHFKLYTVSKHCKNDTDLVRVGTYYNLRHV